MELVTLKIDNQPIEVEAGATILEAAEKAGVEIPTLCYLKEINAIGACRVCVVEVEGAKALQAACVTPVSQGMDVRTNTSAVRRARRLTLELILSNHPFECLTCIRSQNCELQKLAEAFGIREVRFAGENQGYDADFSSSAIVREPEKCILCRRCVSVCGNVQTVHAIAPQERGFNTTVAPAFHLPMAESVCVCCGQCTLVCPTAALHEKEEVDLVWAALTDPKKHVIVQTAPATRVSLGEELGVEPGSIVTGRMITALRMLGFDKVFDTDFTADLTILEEGNELLHRVKTGGTLPLITSCSPGWIKFIEHFYPELLPHLSTCKSPQQMLGALAKTYYAEKMGIDPADIFVVSHMPCTAKKYEARRPEMQASGYYDIDVVLTTREVGRMMREAGINFTVLPLSDYDSPLGLSTGAGLIFGATGGVMEAALRTVYEVVTHQELQAVEFEEVRGLQGVKETAVDLAGLTVKVAVAHTLGNARKLMEAVKNGTADYHFIEIMTCPGGCIGGGGQSIPTNTEIRIKRISGIYAADELMVMRKSHLNPAVQELYKDFLGEPLGHKSHELLHTHYHARGKY
ncbi:MAG: NADP-reducing hydrogenase subunit HndC [Syntrophomonadaceae bacterium]|nr:NADP-reducing hydrogenase subunit HndC [Bacillota bacterium]